MDLENYINFKLLTGIELTQNQINQYPFNYQRALYRLEKLLGWSISQRSIYEEVGKANNESFKFNQSMNDDQYQLFIKGLKAPDEENGTLRLFPYSYIDTNFLIDPAKAIYKLKLVIPVRGSDEQFITIKEFKNYLLKINNNNYINYIELLKENNCYKENIGNALLMVDGDWIKNTFPDQLVHILADLIIYEFQQRKNLSLTTTSSSYAIKSESVSNHSITYDTSTKVESRDPLQNQEYLNIIKNWIGPYSQLNIKVRII